MTKITKREIMESLRFTSKFIKAERMAKKVEKELSSEQIALANNAGRTLLNIYDESVLCNIVLNLCNEDYYIGERGGFEAAGGSKEEMIDFIIEAYDESVICKRYLTSQVSNFEYLSDVSKLYLAGKDIKSVCIKEKYEPMKGLLSVLY